MLSLLLGAALGSPNALLYRFLPLTSVSFVSVVASSNIQSTDSCQADLYQWLWYQEQSAQSITATLLVSPCGLGLPPGYLDLYNEVSQERLGIEARPACWHGPFLYSHVQDG